MATTDKEMETLRKDLDALKAQFAALSDDGGDLLESARQKLEAEAEKLVASLKDAGGAAAKKGEQLIHQAEDKIGENPWVSVLATLGAGVAIGMLLRRR